MWLEVALMQRSAEKSSHFLSAFLIKKHIYCPSLTFLILTNSLHTGYRIKPINESKCIKYYLAHVLPAFIASIFNTLAIFIKVWRLGMALELKKRDNDG